MKARAKVWIVGIVAALIWLVVVYVVLNVLGLSGREYKYVATALITLGTGAICWLMWYFLNELSRKEGQKDAPVDEIDRDIHAARNRLVAAKLSDKTRLSQLPLLLCLGPADSAKTSILIRSGLDPDLLTGEVQRGDAVVATRGVNLWYSNKTVLLEAGGRLVADAGRFTRLLRYLQPSRTSAVLTAGRQAPRVAIVTLSVEDLARAGGGETVTTHARELRARLLETSKKLGIRLPVYVVFTKADKLPYFADFVRNFSSEEAREVLGATLPWDSGPAGTYADRTASRIGSAMQRLAGSLAAHRLQFLPRENQPAVGYNAYEFAREFRKIVPQATQFLVDLCKPSQLEVSPVLRGFYFTGVRAVVVEEAGLLQQQAQQRQAPGAMDATQAFVPAAFGMPQAAAAPVGPVSRKVPQWMFLGRLFKDVIFKDRVALAATAGGARVNLLRRVVLATAAGLSVFYALMLIISFAGNRRLKNRVEAAIRNVSADALPAGDLATVETLRRLDTLRMVNEQLGTWNREGAPIGLKWGLYSGNSLWRQSNRVYFARFDSLMYAGTFNRILENMRNFPAAPSDSTDYQWTYNQLKAHLITTINGDRSTPEFLEPVLLDAWKQGHEIPSDEKIRLARAQFAYFAGELARGNNMLPSPADTLLIHRAQDLLRQFKDGQQIYLIMQSEAAKTGGARPFDYDKTYPNAVIGTGNTVIPAAFTRKGWKYMTGVAFKNPDTYFQGEEWVLGQEKLSERQRAEVLNKIRTKYHDDYVRYWRALLANARVSQFAGLADAARKVKVLGGNPSPLIQLINAVSFNTAVDSIAAATTFQPALAVSPPDTIKVISDGSAPYLKAVQALGTALDAVAAAPPNERQDPAQQAKQLLSDAKNAASAMGIGFAPNSVGPDILRLLTSGFPAVDGALGNVGVNGLNKSGADFCSTFGKVLTKGPFIPGGPPATLDEVTAFFGRPDGAMWSFYNSQLAKFLTPTGSGSYAPTPGSSVKVNPRFAQFFSRAAQFSKALYPDGSDQVPRLGFSFRAEINTDVTLVKLVVDANNRVYSATRTGDQPFTWIGETAAEARIEATIRGNTQPLAKSGTWALFQLFAQARNWKQSGLKYTGEWVFQHENQSVPVKFELTLPGGNPILSPDWLRGMSCVSAIGTQ